MANRISLVSEKIFHETLPITRSAKIVCLENLANLYCIYMYVYIISGDMENESMGSDGSDSEDDFVVVIPDCFNLDVPLSTSCPSLTRSCDQMDDVTRSHEPMDDIMSQSHDDTVVPQLTPSDPVEIPASSPSQSQQDSSPCPKPRPQTPPTSAEPKVTPTASPRMGRRPFVPERVTLRGVKDARLTNPLTVATGLVNTVADLVEGLTLPNKKRNNTEKDGSGEEIRGEAVADVKEVPVPREGGRKQEHQEEEEDFVVSALIQNLGVTSCGGFVVVWLKGNS